MQRIHYYNDKAKKSGSAKEGKKAQNKIVDGSDVNYNQFPFHVSIQTNLYGGMWYGLLGGVLALILVIIVLLVIRQPAQELVSLYNSDFKLILPSLIQSLLLVLTSVFLGLVGSWLAVNRRISKIQPS